MERRLCYFYGPEQSHPHEAEGARPRGIEKQTRTNLGTLETSVDQTVQTTILRKAANPQALENTLNKNFGEELPNRLRKVSAMYAPLLRGPQGVEQRLLQSIAHTGDIREQVRQMIEAIALPIPPQAAQAPFKHRYVRLDKGNKRTPDWYGVDFNQIKTDRQTLASLRKINAQSPQPNPSLSNDILVLEKALAEFEMQDGRITAYTIRNMPSPMNSTFKELGRLSLILAGGAMTFITGFLGLLNLRKRGPTAMSAALLYAALTFGAAKPDTIKRLFGPRYKVSLDELQGAMNGKGLESASLKYNVQGPAWKTFVSQLMQNSAETRTFLRDAEKFGADTVKDNAAISAYVKRVMPNTGTARADLERMIRDKALKPFAERIMDVKNKDAQETVLDIVGTGAMQYARVARAAPQDLPREQTLPKQNPAPEKK